MMSIGDSENFPRGGKKIIKPTEKAKRKHSDNLFTISNPQNAKRPRKDKKVDKGAKTEEVWQMSLKLQGTLTYDRIKEDMLLLCCVKSISNLALQVEFPGLTFGHVAINEISDVYNDKLSKDVNEGDDNFITNTKKLIKVGQLCPAKILSSKKIDQKFEVTATINPKLINSDKKHNSFVKGQIVWGNIVSELDHGYEMSLGVNNCRVFLPHKNVDDDRTLEIGKPLFCAVHKVDTSDTATTLTVSVKRQHIANLQSSDLTLNHVLPGMKIEMIIEEFTPHGIKGQFFDNCVGYIDETQMINKSSSKKLKEGGTVSAYVLFVEPITKVTYLTLRGLDDAPEPKLAIGKINSAQVTSVVGNGLYLKLGEDEIGFVTNKRLLKTLAKDAQLDVIQSVKKKFPVGSRHDCRILDYSYMQQLYICSLEKQIIKEKVFSVKDLTLGQLVKLKVVKILPNGLVVKTGQLQGFVPNLHLSNVAYSENIKSKFTVGQNLDGRVLNIASDGNVIFTLKAGLVEAQKCLTKLEDATPNTQFVGFIVQTKLSGALVAFYGDIKGWISSKTLNHGNIGRHSDPREYFFLGQVVTVWSLGLKLGKLQLTLTPIDKDKSKMIQIGEFLSGIVVRMDSDYMELKCPGKIIQAILPTAHLSSLPEICPVLKNLYKQGNLISNLLCINNAELAPIVSRREALAFQKDSIKMYKLIALKKNMILRCSFMEETESGIYVIAPIRDFSQKIFVKKENIAMSDCNFRKHQSLIGKVLSANFDEKKIELAITEEKTSKDYNIVLNSFSKVLQEFDFLVDLCQLKNFKLTQYKIGSRVKCQVQEIESSGNCLVTLPDEVNGRIQAHLAPTKCYLGQTIEGVVLDYNFVDNVLELCGKNILNQKINKDQDGKIDLPLGSSCMARILLNSKFYAVGVITNKECNRQLFYSPLCFNEDLQKDKIKVTLCKKVLNKIIAFPKKHMLDKDKKKKIQTKQKVKKIKKLEITNSVVDVNDTKVEIISDDETENEEEDNSEDAVLVEGESETETKTHDNNKSDHKDIKVTEFSKGSVLSGATSFYADDELKEESSSEDEEEETQLNKKKKKLTASERAEAARKEEERIAQIEKQLADPESVPQTADQFDRLLLANPNSSELWLQYIAMHVAATELDKARAVGKRAIDTINMTLTKEKFNIWIALLNLENMYGTKESFEKVFEDAVKYNDSLEIYLSVIKMLASSGKLIEMEEKIKKIRTKEKQNTEMWLEIGKVYYNLQKFREARNVKEAALKSILDKKRQFDIIIRFGILEFQLGEFEQAIANFETILETYPAKVNIWTIYVDQLVKRKNIEHARKVLERAVSQRFALKTMKILFQKFISFEEQHGTPEAVQKVKQLAKEYVNRIGVK